MKNSAVSKLCLAITITVFFSLPGYTQENNGNYDLKSMAEKDQLELINRSMNTFSENGKEAIHLSASENDGVAWLKHVIFSNGTIELDIR